MFKLKFKKPDLLKSGAVVLWGFGPVAACYAMAPLCGRNGARCYSSN